MRKHLDCSQLNLIHS